MVTAYVVEAYVLCFSSGGLSEDTESPQQGGCFHGLRHIPRYSMLAAEAVKNAAAKRGMQEPTDRSVLANGCAFRSPSMS